MNKLGESTIFRRFLVYHIHIETGYHKQDIIKGPRSPLQPCTLLLVKQTIQCNHQRYNRNYYLLYKFRLTLTEQGQCSAAQCFLVLQFSTDKLTLHPGLGLSSPVSLYNRAIPTTLTRSYIAYSSRVFLSMSKYLRADL